MSFDVSVILKYYPVFLTGLSNTLFFCVVSVGIGISFGFVLFLYRSSRIALLRSASSGLVGLIRDTPFLIQVYIVFYALPRLGILMDPTTAGVVCLSVYGAAYYSEAIRGAVLSVPRGQMDSARAIGMSHVLAIRRIILPQALGYLIPALTNQTIGLIKESSILAVVTIPEITMSAQIVLGFTFSPVESYTAAALLYWGLTASVALVAKLWERKALGYQMAQAPVQGPQASMALLSRD